MSLGSKKLIKNGRGLLELVVSESSWRMLDSWETLQFWSNQNWHFWHLQICTQPGQTVSDYHPLFNGKWDFDLLLWHFFHTLFCNTYVFFFFSKLILRPAMCDWVKFLGRPKVNWNYINSYVLVVLIHFRSPKKTLLNFTWAGP